MKTWQDRLLELLDKSQYKSMTELCRVSGIATSTFSTALKGSHVPKTTTLDKVASVLNTTSDYILNGSEDEEPAVVSDVPVLTAEQVGDWLSMRLKLQTVADRIKTPKPVHKQSFAWRVDTIDMKPFKEGTTVIIEPNQCFAKRHIGERVYVLVSKKRPMIHQVTLEQITNFDQITDLVEKSRTSRTATSAEPDYERHERHVTLVELAKTIFGYKLLPGDRRSSQQLDFTDYHIVGRVKYSINAY